MSYNIRSITNMHHQELFTTHKVHSISSCGGITYSTPSQHNSIHVYDILMHISTQVEVYQSHISTLMCMSRSQHITYIYIYISYLMHMPLFISKIFINSQIHAYASQLYHTYNSIVSQIQVDLHHTLSHIRKQDKWNSSQNLRSTSQYLRSCTPKP